MRVIDKQRWTSAKKKTAGVFMITGIFLSFGVESSKWWIFPAFMLSATAVIIINSIQAHEW